MAIKMSSHTIHALQHDDSSVTQDVDTEAQDSPPPGSTTALVPSDPQLSSLSVEAFREQLEKVELWTSYTGPVPQKLDSFYNRPLIVKGMITQRISDTNEETGETKSWNEIRLKLAATGGDDPIPENTIIAASGKGANQFAGIVLPSFGQGDWPVKIKVLVKPRTLGNGHPMPSFQVLGPVE